MGIPLRLAMEQIYPLYYRGMRGKFPPDALHMPIPGEYNWGVVSLDDQFFMQQIVGRPGIRLGVRDPEPQLLV
ncbi:hypothetical protein LCGC14_2177500 [marine sediment metagenome]|uniref:Uncharacterized protein n=1 Tax=marine sediment metagenome TaxID=412755 RepID=A0A0F9G0T0_9ZZZZ